MAVSQSLSTLPGDPARGKQPAEWTSAAALGRRWLGLVLLDALLLGGGFGLLRGAWGNAPAGRWAGLAGLALASQLVYLRPQLRLNRAVPEGPLLPTLGPGNALTLLRGSLIALLVGFLAASSPAGWLAWAPAALYTLSDLADYADGALARLTGRVTQMGAALDIAYDGQGLLVALALAVRYGRLPAWLLVIGLARYAYLLELWLMQRGGRRPRPLPESDSRRPLAGMMMGFVSVVLWPIVTPPVTTLAGTIFAVPFCLGFARDGLVVSGLLDPDSTLYRETRARLKRLALHWAPLTLRASAVYCLTRLTLPLIAEPAGQVAQLARAGYPWPEAALAAIAVTQAGSLVLLALGGAGRLAALVALAPLALAAPAGDMTPLRAAGLASVLGLLILGTGAWSLWQPEARLFRRRDGEGG